MKSLIDWVYSLFCTTHVLVVWRGDTQDWRVSIKVGLFGKTLTTTTKTYGEAYKWIVDNLD